jgi:hypothetical protein
MNLPDRYSLCVTFHECHSGSAKIPSFGAVSLPAGAGWVTPAGERPRTAGSAPANFLGKTAANVWSPVVAAWRGADPWRGDCGALWHGAETLGLPTAGTFKDLCPDLEAPPGPPLQVRCLHAMAPPPLPPSPSPLT